MATTAFTRHIVAVVRPAVAAAINTALKHVSFDPVGGDHTFDVPLRTAGDATNTVVGYWCAGAATPAMLAGLSARLGAAGATAAERSLIPQSATLVSVATQRIFVFDADVWTPDQVLTFLGVDRLTPVLTGA